jgi:heterodisulfide reductase subunit B
MMKYGFFPGCSYKGAAGYRESTEVVLQTLGIELAEITDWNCCGATSYWSTQRLSAYVLPARIMALAQKQGYSEIVNVCNACYATLRKANERLAEDAELLGKVNLALGEEGLCYTGALKIRHLMEVLMHDMDAEAIRSHVRKDLSELVVAPYYGCQLDRPWADLDDAHYPVMMDRLIETVGAKPLENYSAKTECCGAAHMVAHKDLCLPLNERIIRDAAVKGAQTICTLCPLCQFNVDSCGTLPGLPKMPVIFFTQLMGLAFGFSEKELQLRRLLTPFEVAI